MNSFTEENYLKAIYKLTEGSSKGAGTNEIARLMSTKAASVTDMIGKLSKKKLVNYVKYQGVTLSPKGVKVALSIIRKHRLWEVFLVDKLGFRWDEVHDVAEQLEHINSEKLIQALDDFLGHPKYDPHGDPIPSSDGVLESKKMVALNEKNKGYEGVVVGVSEHSSVFLQYLDRIRLTLGTRVKILEKNDYDHSLSILINNETEQQISKEVAKNVLVYNQ